MIAIGVIQDAQGNEIKAQVGYTLPKIRRQFMILAFTLRMDNMGENRNTDYYT